MVEVVAIGEPLVAFYGASRGSLVDERVFHRTWGGDTSNFVLAVAKLGHHPGYVTRVGCDPWGESLLNLWKQAGVDTSHVVTDPDRPTGLYFSSRHDANHEFVYHRENSAASRLCPDDIDPHYIAAAKVVHLSGITQAISYSSLEASFFAMNVAKEHGVLISYDPNIRPRFWSSGAVQAVVRYTVENLADIVLATSDELRALFGDVAAPEAADRLIARGAKLIAVKMGRRGCYIASHSGAAAAKAFEIQVEDTVGAGDAFDAAVIACLLEGQPLDLMARFANAAAALTCRGRGPLESQPTREEVQQFLIRLA